MVNDAPAWMHRLNLHEPDETMTRAEGYRHNLLRFVAIYMAIPFAMWVSIYGLVQWAR